MKLSDLNTSVGEDGCLYHDDDGEQIYFFKEGWICSNPDCDAEGDYEWENNG